MTRKPTSQMFDVLRDITQAGGTDNLWHLLSQGHDISALYRCVCRGWLRWVHTSGYYEITDAGRTIGSRLP